jgi:hypothetical protein
VSTNSGAIHQGGGRSKQLYDDKIKESDKVIFEDSAGSSKVSLLEPCRHKNAGKPQAPPSDRQFKTRESCFNVHGMNSMGVLSPRE